MNKVTLKIKFIEVLIVLYFFLGMLKRFSILQYSDYLLALIIQTYFLTKIFYGGRRVKVKKNIIILYACNLVIIFFIFLHFIYIGVSVNKIIDRIFPLISIFGMIIINSNSEKINAILIVKKTVELYVYLGVIIILDVISYLLLGNNIWTPISYLEYRFSGPFYDANFYGIVYAVILIIVLYCNKLNFKRKKIYMLISVINIFLGRSWSVISILAFSIIIHYFIKSKNLFFKQVLLIGIYLYLVFQISLNIESIRILFISLTTRYLNLSYLQALAKFKSFELRIDAQLKALKMLTQNILGQGPQQIVPQIGMDVHNSYVGFQFEMGLLGTILQIINIRNKKQNCTQLIDILTTFILLMAFTINVHYSVVYTLVIFMMFNHQFEEKYIK